MVVGQRRSQQPFELRSEVLGPLPVVNHFLGRLKLSAALDRHVPADDRRLRLAPAAVTFGHNKDHRPDLRQLVWILTVSADGAVPLAHRVASGNTGDDTTHVPTWDELVALVLPTCEGGRDQIGYSALGSMFWFSRKKLSGSTRRLSWTSRSQFGP